MRLIKINCIILCFIFSFNASWAQDTLKSNRPTEEGAALEQVLAKIEAMKNDELKKLTVKLSSQLNKAVDEYISKMNAQKNSQLNSLVDQSWEKSALTQPISPLHYNYYLKGYSYNKSTNDIVKSDSLTSPYKAWAIIIEELYVEKYHPSNISNIDPYFFTVTGSITLNLEHHNDAFVITNSEYKLLSIENDCPETIKRMKL